MFGKGCYIHCRNKERTNKVKKNCYIVILLLLAIMLVTPRTVSAADYKRVVTSYSGGSWKQAKGKKYYYHKGKKVTGWAKINKNIYYFHPKTGQLHLGWLVDHGKKYYFKKTKNTGIMATGLYRIEGKYYYFGENGNPKAGLIVLNGGKQIYYADPSTLQLLTGQWKKTAKGWYYFALDARGRQGWFELKGKHYYCHKTKGKLSGWNKISGVDYLFNEKGYAVADRWINKGSETWFLNDRGKVVLKVKNTDSCSRDYSMIYMVGDSRFAFTKEYGITACGADGSSNVTYISKKGWGLNWMKASYEKLKTEVMKEYDYNKKMNTGRKTAIVCNLGVNDLYNCSEYLDYVKEKYLPLADEYECDIYYVSVNPINYEKYSKNTIRRKNRTPAQIVEFNRIMRSFCAANKEIEYVDTYTYLKKLFKNHYGDLTTDGVHYNKEVSQIIFDKIMVSIKPKPLSRI